jgi:hypothetical protein
MTAVVRPGPLYHDVGHDMLGAREAEVPVKLDRDLRQARPGEINAGRIAVHELHEFVLEAGGDLQRGGVGLSIRRHASDGCTGREGVEEDTEQ